MKKLIDRRKGNGYHRRCPVCHRSDQVIPVEYGLPTEDLIADMLSGRTGEVHLGGCLVGNDDPKWFCKRDNITF
jgi:hypothetical protein